MYVGLIFPRGLLGSPVGKACVFSFGEARSGGFSPLRTRMEGHELEAYYYNGSKLLQRPTKSKKNKI